MKNNFVFAYGSLINRESRYKDTGDSKVSYGNLRSFRRNWCINLVDRKMTSLGVFKDPDSYCNGVYLPVTEDILQKLDIREIKGSHGKYKRILLDNRLCEKKFKDNYIYTYVASVEDKPTSNMPIVQSYLDVTIAGCLDYSFDFAVDFARSTFGWNSNLVNDRQSPVYRHPVDLEHLYSKIDSILSIAKKKSI